MNHDFPGIDSREESIFLALLETPEEDRNARLDEQCGDDEALRARVTQLLSLHDTREGILESVDTSWMPGAVETRVGDRIGPYELREEIGTGGMGVVYCAEQQEPVRRVVALKLIKPGMDTRSVVARFEAERQALALLDHPGITKVFDGGVTTSGRPYFVMELCSGSTITRYARELDLDLEARLDLFAQVCETVEHAHKKGIIHRDLKPSNVVVTLVDGLPRPKVIDFGIAKALTQPLTASSSVTLEDQWLGTPEYMSPEQAGAQSDDIDTRSDVYSLGVLLYELVTGTTPFRDLMPDLDGLRSAIRATEPVLPSVCLRREGRDPSTCRFALRVRGEIDWIVTKALAKHRQRRYQSAAEFARDVRRYLAGDAVEAVAPTLGYRLRKGLHRHRVAALVSSTLTASLLVGGIVSTVLAFKAFRAEQELSTSLADVKRERDRARDAEGRLARMEREQRNRAAVYRAAARYAQDTFAPRVKHMIPELVGSLDVGPDSPLADFLRGLDRGDLITGGGDDLDELIAEVDGSDPPRPRLDVEKLLELSESSPFPTGGVLTSSEISVVAQGRTGFSGATWGLDFGAESPDVMPRFSMELGIYVVAEQERAFGASDPIVAETRVALAELALAGADGDAEARSPEDWLSGVFGILGDADGPESRVLLARAHGVQASVHVSRDERERACRSLLLAREALHGIERVPVDLVERIAELEAALD